MVVQMFAAEEPVGGDSLGGGPRRDTLVGGDFGMGARALTKGFGFVSSRTAAQRSPEARWRTGKGQADWDWDEPGARSSPS